MHTWQIVIGFIAFILAGLMTMPQPAVKVRPALLEYQGRYFGSNLLWALGCALFSDSLLKGVALFCVLALLVELRRRLTDWAK